MPDHGRNRIYDLCNANPTTLGSEISHARTGQSDRVAVVFKNIFWVIKKLGSYSFDTLEINENSVVSSRIQNPKMRV